MLYSHEQLYIHIFRCMQNHNNDTIKTSDIVLSKNTPLTLFEMVRKGYLRFYCVRGELEAEQNCNILILIPASSRTDLNFNCSIGGLRAPSAGCLFSLPHLISNRLNFLCTELYNNLTPTLLPASVTISHSIQPVHGQGYILIFLDRMHLLFAQVHFLF